MLQDKFGRVIDYVRWSVTDRCNLRCTYCMPEENMNFVPRKELLSFEEMEQMLRVFGDLGIKKLRFTGGEPFMRKDIMRFFEKVAEDSRIEHWHLTSNGTLLLPHIKRLAELNISGINLSLDTLSPERFHQLTRRDSFSEVWTCLESILENDIPLKINTVVQARVNFSELKELAALAKEKPLDMRFIEYMPFNGNASSQRDFISAKEIENELRKHYQLHAIPMAPGATSQDFKIDGFQGKIGIIAAHTRTFCGSCNRLRFSAKGNTQTCLYGIENVSLGKLIKSNASDSEIKSKLTNLISGKPRNGFEAEAEMLANSGQHRSMSTIGG
ncbi:MAG: GTP 3',8-cyclase MoaA [Flavobacteriales bacterium]|nr:GTP 3',8-cyclase MoaA [Flavobacteriales bacterium]